MSPFDDHIKKSHGAFFCRLASILSTVVLDASCSAAQCAESGGQGDLGQIFIQNADFHKGMAKNKTA